jgi:N-hydroxyarylamine O-acetyltransferase
VEPGLYLQRIGYAGSTAPSEKLLAELIRQHLEAVPFETLSIHSGERILLEEAWLLDKIVRRRRGGFCYELNGAFAWLLRALGFRVGLLAGRVYDHRGELGIPFDHMALRVELDQPLLVDVGFGESPMVPLAMVPADVQSDGLDDYRLSLRGDEWTLSRLDDDGWADKYQFSQRLHSLPDFAPGCAFHQGLDSPFAVGPVCSAIRNGGRLTLNRKKLVVTDANRRKTETLLGEGDFHRLLEDHFDIAVL